MDMGGAGWALINIVGPLLLLLALAWAVLRNRKSSRAEIELTEEATRDVSKAEDAAPRQDNDFGT